MFNKYVSPRALIIFFSVMIFIITLWLCLSNDQFMDLILEKSSAGLPTLISLAVSGYSGYGLNRLNAFDKLEDLKEEDAARLNKQISQFRRVFEGIIGFSLVCGIVIFMMGLIASSVQNLTLFSILSINFKIIFGIVFSFILSAIILLLACMKIIFNHISQLRDKVISLSQIEKRRKALLTRMREQADKNPFNEMDFHLKKYNQTVNHDQV